MQRIFTNIYYEKFKNLSRKNLTTLPFLFLLWQRIVDKKQACAEFFSASLFEFLITISFFDPFAIVKG